MDKTFEEEALYELHFWLQILENHSQFIHDSLAPNERENIETANSFKEWFAQCICTFKRASNEQQLYWLLQQTKNASEEIRNFKLQLLKDQLVGTIQISLYANIHQPYGQ